MKILSVTTVTRALEMWLSVFVITLNDKAWRALEDLFYILVTRMESVSEVYLQVLFATHKYTKYRG